jgi:hypothetical protein
MRSPKFKFVRKDLEKLFYESGIRSTWTKNVRQQVKKQALQDIIDFRDFDQDIDITVSNLKNAVLTGLYEPKPAKRFLIEKSQGLCRQMTVVHPQDLLVLEMLSRIVHADLTKAAPTKKAYFQPNDGNFKNRFLPLDEQYGSFASWKRFQQRVFQFAEECNYVIVTDVANFFDFIDFRHLRNIIAENAQVRETFLDLLMIVLQRLSWSPDYMPSSQVGMPQMESSAPRVLANAMLYEVDRVAVDVSGDNYARYMDDIDIGIDSIAKAKEALRDIDLSLQSRQLRLNSGKTRILEAKSAYLHFRIDENVFLAEVEQRLSKGSSSASKQAAAKDLDEKYFSWWGHQNLDRPSSDSIYLSGNGGKVLKWAWRLRRIANLDNPQEHLLWAIMNEPSLRSNAFGHLAFTSNSHNALPVLINHLRSGNFVDDQSFLDLSRFLIYARFPKFSAAGERVKADMNKVVQAIIRNEAVGVFCALQILAKFGNRLQILDVAKNHYSRIASDYWTARAFAGCFPRFQSRSASEEFERAVARLGSDAANSVYRFHESLDKDVSFVRVQMNYLKSPNLSLRTGVEFAKILMLLTVKENSRANEEYNRIVAGHKQLPLDEWFRDLGFNYSV